MHNADKDNSCLLCIRVSKLNCMRKLTCGILKSLRKFAIFVVTPEVAVPTTPTSFPVVILTCLHLNRQQL